MKTDVHQFMIDSGPGQLAVLRIVDNDVSIRRATSKANHEWRFQQLIKRSGPSLAVLRRGSRAGK